MSKAEIRKGDYVSLEGISKDQYHAVEKAFMEAGADSGEEYGEFGYENWKFLGWGECGALDHHDYHELFSGRHLTIEQVLGEEEDETATIQSLLKKAEKHARKAQKHEAKRQEAIEQARALLPDGWELTPSIDQDVRIGYTPLSELDYCEFNVGVFGADGEDLTDPANWREGDVVECVRGNGGVTVGRKYTISSFDEDGDPSIKENDHGCKDNHYADVFKFHHRP